MIYFTLDRNQPGYNPMLSCDTLIFFNLPNARHLIVNVSTLVKYKQQSFDMMTNKAL